MTAYAQDVVAKRVVAGPDVRAACQRHLDDLAHAVERGLRWDLAAAHRFFEFCRELLYVEVDGELVPFELLPWQIFAAGNLFGWKMDATGYRRFTLAYIEAGKGCGKTPFAAAVGLYMMVADGEFGAEIYAAGSNKEQAAYLFADAVKMVSNSPVLDQRLKATGANPVWQLKHMKSQSLFKPISSSKTRSGLRVQCALVDELHEHKNSYVLDMMKFGTKNRNQPLIFIITNSGFDRKSVCFQYHEDALRVVHGLRENLQLFVMIFSLDPGDDPLENEACWPKTNPGLGTTLKIEYLRERVAEARAIPGRESITRRLNFCEWTDAETTWLTRKAWTEIEADLVDFKGGKAVPDNDFSGAVCCAAIDLSWRFDLTALAVAFPEEDGTIAAWIEYFTPGETALEREQRDKTPYTTWIKEGLIHAVPGNVVRREYVAARLAEIKAEYDLEDLAYDRYAHKSLDREVAELGIDLPWIEHPQGFRRGGIIEGTFDPLTGKPLDNPLWMPESVMELETMIVEKSIAVQVSPVTRWQVSSTVIRQDPAGTGNRVFDKNKALGRIDGIVALAMVVGAIRMRRPAKPDIGKFLNMPVVKR